MSNKNENGNQHALDFWHAKYFSVHETNILSVKYKYQGTGWLLILSAKIGDKYWVHFDSAGSLAAVEEKLEYRLRKNDFEWREDKWRNSEQ